MAQFSDPFPSPQQMVPVGPPPTVVTRALDQAVAACGAWPTAPAGAVRDKDIPQGPEALICEILKGPADFAKVNFLMGTGTGLALAIGVALIVRMLRAAVRRRPA